MKKEIPTHDPQTGELNPYYEELTGERNPLQTVLSNFNKSNKIGNNKKIKEKRNNLKKRIENKNSSNIINFSKYKKN